MRDFLTEIISKVQLDEDSVEVESLDENGRYCSIEGESKNGGGEEKYLVYDCSGRDQEFEFDSYNEKMEMEEGISRPIIVFENWDQEWALRQRAYAGLRKAADKKRLLGWFEKKLSFYTGLENNVELEAENKGENYLEYQTELPFCPEEEKRQLSGRSYNLSFQELKKIFNVTGKELFRRNVRFGLKNNSTGNQLQLRFKEYIKIGAYLKWIKDNPKDRDVDEVKKIFEVEEGFETRVPENFWFYHNGITIFYYGGDGIDFRGNRIKFNPRNVSVINGAQTLTNIFEGIKMLPEEFRSNCANFIEEEERVEGFVNFFTQYIEVAMDKMKVKTIFIEGPEEYVQPITYGLNTQIPIMETDIIADSKEVEHINSYLQKKNMKIIKTGEVGSVEKDFSVLEFVKDYLIIQGKPGKSKNLRRADVQKYMEEAERVFANNEGGEEALEAIYDVCIMEKWWKASKKIREANYTEEGQRVYTNNAKNYFESFVLAEKKEPLDDEYLMLLYDMFINTFIKLEASPEVKTLKNDELFERYIEERSEKEITEKDAVSAENILNDAECKGLQEFLNEQEPSPYTVQKTIREYLDMIGKNIDYFRVIARTGGKVREAFPFPSSTFSEIYQDQTKTVEEKKYKKYEESSFCAEVKKKIPIFVIDWTKEEEERPREAEKVWFIEEFSFATYNEKAKEVYKKTITAFEKGDEESLPKMKDDLAFHIRPKAINAEDTFEFSNGKQITKRTFWANKNTLDELLENFIQVRG